MWTGAVAVNALLIAATAPAAENSTSGSPAKQCPQMQRQDRELAEPALLALPEHSPAFVSVTETVMTLSGLSGDPICVPLDWISVIESVWLSPDDHFFGFEHRGYEAHGYTLVDRAGAGTIIATGNRPLFSPSGKRFAFAQTSDAGWGNFEGIAVWEVEGSRSLPLISVQLDEAREAWVGTGPIANFAFLDRATEAMDLRVEGWESESMVRLSSQMFDADFNALAQRQMFFVVEAGRQWFAVSDQGQPISIEGVTPPSPSAPPPAPPQSP